MVFVVYMFLIYNVKNKIFFFKEQVTRIKAFAVIIPITVFQLIWELHISHCIVNVRYPDAHIH